MNKCIVTIKIDITDLLPRDWKTMSTQEIKEFCGDTPEVMFDGEFVPTEEGNIVHKVEKVNE